jgi:flagellar FliL protein
MPTATAVDAAPPPGKGRKKLILIVAALLSITLAAGAGVVFVLKKQAAVHAAADEDGEAAPAARAAAAEPKAPPVFVPLDPFTVNLADRDAERYVQIGMTLEVDDAKMGDRIKLFMPAIRNNILMAIADKTAGQLMDREGKRRLALEVRRETSRALGFEVAADDEVAPDRSGDGARSDRTPARSKRRDHDADLPVKAVHFNNFIIQ